MGGRTGPRPVPCSCREVVRASLKITIAHKRDEKRPYFNVSPETVNAIYFPPLGTIPSTHSLSVVRFRGAVAGVAGLRWRSLRGVQPRSSGVRASDWRPRHDKRY